MFLIGLTGGIASGKSTVSAMLQQLGVPVVDADTIARQVVEPGSIAWHKIRDAFGEEVFSENGELDRGKLGALIFNDIEKRKLINRITHPEIYSRMRKQVLFHFMAGEQMVVLDLPLLYETESVLPYVYKTMVVYCSEAQQVERLMARGGYSREDALARIQAQIPLDDKCKRADFVVENSDSVSYTRKQVEDIVKLLRSSNRHIRNRWLYGSITLFSSVIIMALLSWIAMLIWR